MATSISLAYSGFLEAARIREGLVVASCGLYLPMVAKSPESQTTVVPVAFNWSSELGMLLLMIMSTVKELGGSGKWCTNESAGAANMCFFLNSPPR